MNEEQTIINSFLFAIIIVIVIVMLTMNNVTLNHTNREQEAKINELQNKVYQQYELIDALKQNY